MTPRVNIAQGALEGLFEQGVYRFLGVPFARPPTGDRRWRAPEAPLAWGGVRAAKSFSPACPQTGGAVFELGVREQSEDCLYLNVWTRTLDSSAQQPVMVWVHGGGFLGGAGSEEGTDGARLAAKGATVVSFNYRLGAFGFLAHPKLGANFGLLDQVAALRWVQSNIRSFGGDPQCVTVFGESAGAVAIRTLLAYGLCSGLVHRAIMESAGFEPPAFARPRTYAQAGATAEELFERLGTDSPEALRALPAAGVLQVSHELSGVFPRPGEVHTPAKLVWVPVEDGTVLAGQGGGLGALNEIPILMGFNRNEARYFLRPTLNFGTPVLVGMSRAFGGPQADALMAELQAEDGDLYDKIDRIFTASIWAEPALASARRIAGLNPSLYTYRFDRVSPGMRQTLELAKHTAEIRYVFGTLGLGDGYDDTDMKISTLMQDAWLAFARGGVPRLPEDRPWPSHAKGNEATLVIDEELSLNRIGDDAVVRLLHIFRQSSKNG